MKRYTTRSVPADVVQTSSHDSTPAARCVRRHRGAGLSPSTEHRSASQATPGSEPVGPRRPEEPLAQLRWASSPRHRRRSRTDICDQAGGRPSLSVEIHVRRAAARRLPYRRAASQRGGGTTRLVADACAAGVAVVKKVAARFSLRGLRARIDTIAHATESHGVRRATVAVARRTGAQRACRVVRLHTHAESGRAFVRRPGSTEPAPLLTDMRRVGMQLAVSSASCAKKCLIKVSATRATGSL